MRSLAIAAIAVCCAIGTAANASAAGVKKIILGQLGQTTRSMGIHSWYAEASHTYWTVDADQYLVIVKHVNSDWDAVLLQNGHRGYVRSDSVNLMPFQVTKTVSQSPSSPDNDRAWAAENALNYIGTPYVWGGNSLTAGVDCSGFVKDLFGKIGIDLPRTAAEQALVGQPIYRYEDLQRGDRLYFWDKKRGKIGHTGLYIGGGYFVHSSVNHHGVATDYLSEHWRNMLVAARR